MNMNMNMGSAAEMAAVARASGPQLRKRGGHGCSGNDGGSVDCMARGGAVHVIATPVG